MHIYCMYLSIWFIYEIININRDLFLYYTNFLHFLAAEMLVSVLRKTYKTLTEPKTSCFPITFATIPPAIAVNACDKADISDLAF